MEPLKDQPSGERSASHAAASSPMPAHAMDRTLAAAAPSHPSVARCGSARAWHSSASWARVLLVLALGLVFDLGTKHWTFQTVAGEPIVLDPKVLLSDPDYNPIPHHPGVQALPGNLLDLQLVINRGAVFGIGANRRFFFIAFTIGALAAGLLVFGWFTTSRQWLAHVAIGLILAGGIGNLYDRIVYTVVRDFLHMLPEWRLPFGWNWPGGSPELFPWVFNLADVMLLTGMGLLILHMHRTEKRNRKLNEANAKSEHARA
jgi:signal peptidase II